MSLERDAIRKRADYWRARRTRSGRTPVVEFLTTKIPCSQMLSPALWADVWATYALYNGSFEDRRTFGFNGDIANGFSTPIPSLTLRSAFTVGFTPATWAGILGIVLIWQ